MAVKEGVTGVQKYGTNDQGPDYTGLVQPIMKYSVPILVTERTHLQQPSLIGLYQNQQEQLGTGGWSLSSWEGTAMLQSFAP